MWLHALCRWHGRRRRVYVQRVSSRLEEIGLRVFAWASGILYNRGDFDLKIRTKKKAAHKRSVRPAGPCLYAAQPSSTLSHFTRSYILDYKKKREEADYIFTHQCCFFSALQHNLHCYINNLENLTSAPRNLDRTTEYNVWKPITVCLPYVKDRAEKIPSDNSLSCSWLSINWTFNFIT